MDEVVELAEAEDRLVVRQWRFEQFIEAGFNEADSATLAEGTADLSIVRKLIGGGCPLDTALRILL